MKLEREDLTQILTTDRRVGLPLSQGRGHGVRFCSGVMMVTGFRGEVLFEDVWASLL